MAGLIHIYCGDGKGKTTAAVGLALRAAGAGKDVVLTQFFKDGSSSEIAMLRQIPGIRVMHCKTVPGFFFRMTPEQKEQCRRDYTQWFRQVTLEAAGADLLVLDEMLSACNNGVVPLEDVEAFLKTKPEGLEVVLTGRNPAPSLVDAADYVTEMCKRKHPFDNGIPARKGIEF
ncbi:MAG TPA: cob(I)yrinic acid a,c-diamide adenosyltransferase [Candidatus Faecousia intestinavium]|nr:cob(I)yrinic acid a,c-diamide adenosyltransferase [Candidatus Faecousia intestinavium]